MIYTSFPPMSRGRQEVFDVMAEAAKEGRLAVDLEFSPSGPTVFGTASKGRMAAWWWEPEFGHRLLSYGLPISAYAGIGADKPVLEDALQTHIPLDLISDSMLRWWIVNPDLASIPKSTLGEDDSDNHVLGFMNIWAAMSGLHDVPRWKGVIRNSDGFFQHLCGNDQECRRNGWPCAEHDELMYCAADSWAGLVIDYALIDRMSALGIPQSYYTFRAELSQYCYVMQQKGVRISLDIVEGLEAAIQSKKAALFPARLEWYGKSTKTGKPGKLLKKPRKIWEGPFNPSSVPQVLRWFSEHGIELADRGKPSMSKQVVFKALDKRLSKYGLSFNVRSGELDGEQDEELILSEEDDLLLRLAQKSCASKGTKSWVDPRYVNRGRLNPRFNSCGTSMGRLSSSKPNAQNWPRTGFGAQLRKAIIPEPGCCVVKADYSQLELNVCLWFARSTRSSVGIFEWLVAQSDGQFEAAGRARNLSARDVAKSVSHASNYCEGLLMLKPNELSTATRRAEVRAGALLAFDGDVNPLWLFRGRVVCFTGANLAERLFGTRTRVDRAKALALQAIYFQHLPELRDFQREVLEEIERSGEVRLPSGHRLALYNRSFEDDAKQAMACKGQGGGAIVVQEAMCRFGRMGRVFNLQIHDELVATDVPMAWSNEECLDYMKPMVQVSEILPGFSCPIKVSRSLESWGSCKEIGIVSREDV